MADLTHCPILSIAKALQTRLRDYCPLLQAVGISAVTDHKAIAQLIAWLQVLPSAIIIMGPWSIERNGPGSPALPTRTDNIGILVATGYSADLDAGAIDLWPVLDSVTNACLPAASRSEDTRLPINLLGTQGRGVNIYPSGWSPLQGSGDDRAAGILNLLVTNRPADWSALT